MRAVHRSISRPLLAALLALIASPVLAQTPAEPSTRVGLMQTARETLAAQSVKPRRSRIERGLSWYDNQHVFAKLFGGWKGIHLAGGDFPAGAGFTFGLGYDKALTSVDPDPRLSNRVDLTARGAWKSEYPNPAFKQMDAADAFWAASIVSRLTDPMIRGTVEEARLTNSDAARYLAEVLIKRRDKTVRWGITSTNPLDRFEIRDGRVPELAFDNAAVRPRIVNQKSQYEISWAPFDNTIGTAGAIRATVDTREPRVAIPLDVWGPTDAFGFRYAVAMIATIQPAFPHWKKPVQVTVRNRNGHLDVVGVDRPTDPADVGDSERRAQK